MRISFLLVGVITKGWFGRDSIGYLFICLFSGPALHSRQWRFQMTLIVFFAALLFDYYLRLYGRIWDPGPKIFHTDNFCVAESQFWRTTARSRVPS